MVISAPCPKVPQGKGRLADEEDLRKDAKGFTHPNLHRRIDKHKVPAPELAPRKYTFHVKNVNSWRTTDIVIHDEESDRNEVP